jgi:hypothetical protein
MISIGEKHSSFGGQMCWGMRSRKRKDPKDTKDSKDEGYRRDQASTSLVSLQSFMSLLRRLCPSGTYASSAMPVSSRRTSSGNDAASTEQ